MIAAALLGVVAILAFVVWALAPHGRRSRPGPENNWRNEDYLAREADGTWSEGSLHPKSEPDAVFGAPLGKSE